MLAKQFLFQGFLYYFYCTFATCKVYLYYSNKMFINNDKKQTRKKK